MFKCCGLLVDTQNLNSYVPSYAVKGELDELLISAPTTTTNWVVLMHALVGCRMTSELPSATKGGKDLEMF